MSKADPVVSIKPAETVASPEERHCQELYAERIESEADAIAEPSLARAHRDRATVARNSLPISEYYDRLRKLNEAQSEAGPISGLDALEIRGGYGDSIEALKAANLYEPTLYRIMEASRANSSVVPESFLGVNPTDVELAGVVAAQRILGMVEKATPAKPLSTRDLVAKAVDEAFAPSRARLYVLRHELDEFKESRGIR